eukprot:UN11178
MLLKVHTMYFRTVSIWPTCGQQMLTKSSLNSRLEKSDNRYSTVFLIKYGDEFLFGEVLTIKNGKFVYNIWVLHHKRMHYHL